MQPRRRKKLNEVEVTPHILLKKKSGRPPKASNSNNPSNNLSGFSDMGPPIGTPGYSNGKKITSKKKANGGGSDILTGILILILILIQ